MCENWWDTWSENCKCKLSRIEVIYSPSPQGTLDFATAEVLQQGYQITRDLIDAKTTFSRGLTKRAKNIVQFEHNVFLVLKDVTKGMIMVIFRQDVSDEILVLSILTKNDCIHRDVSAGNAHFYEEEGVLGDLEYAKIAGIGGTHEVKTVSA